MSSQRVCDLIPPSEAVLVSDPRGAYRQVAGRWRPLGEVTARPSASARHPLSLPAAPRRAKGSAPCRSPASGRSESRRSAKCAALSTSRASIVSRRRLYGLRIYDIPSCSMNELTRTLDRPYSPKCLSGQSCEVELSLLLGVCGLFFLDYLKALYHLEGEAHYAALLALVLEVDGLVVVVDEHLRHKPAAECSRAPVPTGGYSCAVPFGLARSSARPPFFVTVVLPRG